MGGAIAFQAGPFIKAAGWKQAAFMSEAGAEGGFLHQGFGAGVYDEGEIIRVFDPVRDKPPTDQREFTAVCILLAYNHYRFGGADIVPGRKLSFIDIAELALYFIWCGCDCEFRAHDHSLFC